MKTFRTRSGPFSERPHFKRGEIERMCIEELRAMQLLPAEPSPVRIDRFIERRFNVSPRYEELPVNAGVKMHRLAGVKMPHG